MAVWSVVALAAVVPAASAVGLPFVDIPNASEVASDAVDSASKAIVGMVANAVGSLTNEIIKVSDTLGAPQVGSSNTWFTASYKRTVGVSLWLMAIAALIAVTAAGIRGKVGDMVAVIVVNVPGAIIAMMVATLALQLSLGLTDAMTAYTFRGSVDNIQTFLHNMGTTFTNYEGAAGGAALAPGLALIIGLFVVVAQLVILAILIVRTALIYIVTLFLPLVFAVQVWPATRHMTRKSLELLAVLVFSKFAIFTCFALGAGAASDVLKPVPQGSNRAAVTKASNNAAPPPVQSAIVGFGVMAAAAFSPMLLMSIIPGIAGSFGSGHPGGRSTAGSMAVRTPAQVMRSTLSTVQTVRGSRSPGSGRSHSSGGEFRSPQSGAATPPPAPAHSQSAARETSHQTGPRPAPGGVDGTGAQAQSGGSAPATSAGAPSTLVAGATSAAARHTATTPPAPRETGPQSAASEQSGRAAGARVQPTGGGQATAASVPTSGTRIPPALPTPGAAATSDGFAAVNTRQPFTLETT